MENERDSAGSRHGVVSLPSPESTRCPGQYHHKWVGNPATCEYCGKDMAATYEQKIKIYTETSKQRRQANIRS